MLRTLQTGCMPRRKIAWQPFLNLQSFKASRQLVQGRQRQPIYALGHAKSLERISFHFVQASRTDGEIERGEHNGPKRQQELNRPQLPLPICCPANPPTILAIDHSHCERRCVENLIPKLGDNLVIHAHHFR